MLWHLGRVPFWTVVLLALIFALAASGVLAQGPQPDTDAEITTAIELGLRADRSLEDTDVRVETMDGAVTLRGLAGTMEDIAAAGRIAHRVRGVRGVTNVIRVSVRPSRA